MQKLQILIISISILGCSLETKLRKGMFKHHGDDEKENYPSQPCLL